MGMYCSVLWRMLVYSTVRNTYILVFITFLALRSRCSYLLKASRCLCVSVLLGDSTIGLDILNFSQTSGYNTLLTLLP